MARRISHSRLDRFAQPEASPAQMQPIIGDTGQRTSLRPVPSLAAIEQVGGPELDGRLELPTREPWSTRMSSDLFED